MRKYLIFFIASFFLILSCVFALTEAPVDITKMSLIEIEEALNKGYITSEQLVNIYLERIEEYNDKFNAINQINENAIEQAKELDRMRKEGNIRGKLHGIPIIVKCNIDVYGIPTTAGTKSLKDNMPKKDAEVVQYLVDEGAIVLASANMSELAFSASDSYSSYGHVWNVFNNNKYTPYGSSGGSAVSVKAAFAAAALGTDTNSSVRLPAAGAGLVGIRPTYGLLSSEGVIPYDYERDTVGILSSTVKDSSLLLEIISDGKYKSTNKGSLEGVNIGVATQYVTGNKSYQGIKGLTDEDINDLTLKSIKKLEDAGANIIYLDNFVKDSNISIATDTYAGVTMCYHFNQYIKGTTGKIRSFTQLANSSGHVQGLSGYVTQCDALKESSIEKRESKKGVYREYIASQFDDNNVDVVLYPTLKNRVYKIGDDKNVSPGSSLGSVIGYPSITVPMGFLDDGFSYGIEFLSKNEEESKLYNVALAFEEINGNSVDTSPLTPSLYEISDDVIELNKLYEENLDNKKTKDWVEDVKEFYLNYNDFDNRDEKVSELLNDYKENYDTKKSIINKILVVNKKDSKFVKILKSLFKIVLILIGLYIGLYVFAYTFRFIRRIRRRIRRRKKLKAQREAELRRKKASSTRRVSRTTVRKKASSKTSSNKKKTTKKTPKKTPKKTSTTRKKK